MVRVKVSRVPRLARQGAHELFNDASFVPPPPRLRGRGVTIESLETRNPFRSDDLADAEARQADGDEGVRMSLVPGEAIARVRGRGFAGDEIVADQPAEPAFHPATEPAEWPAAAADVIVHPALAGMHVAGVVTEPVERDDQERRSLQLFARPHSLQAA